MPLPSAAHPKIAQRTRILIVEDEPIIAIDLQDVLTDAGFEVVGIAARLDAAMAFIAGTRFDAAIIDTNLAGASSDPAATAITRLGLPLIVLSGYSMKHKQVVFPRAHFIQKPCRPDVLVSVLRALLADFAAPII